MRNKNYIAKNVLGLKFSEVPLDGKVHGNLCSVRALKLLTGLPFEEVYTLLAKEGLKNQTIMNHSGNIVSVAHKYRYDLYKPDKSKEDLPSLAKFLNDFRTGTYGIFIPEHIFVYSNGTVYDVKNNIKWIDKLLVGPYLAVLSRTPLEGHHLSKNQ